MLGDHPKIDAYKKFFGNADLDDDTFREEGTKMFLLAHSNERAKMLLDMDSGFSEAGSKREEAQLLNHYRYFRDLDAGLKSRNR